jgi:hypothetical protein
MSNYFLYAALCMSVWACASVSSSSSSSNKDRLASGKVCGTITWQAGNRMPSPDRKPTKDLGVSRELRVYELTNIQQVRTENGFIKAVATPLITSVISDKDGKFCISLPAGKYSLIVKEGEKGLWANQYDGEGNIFPITISSGTTSNIDFVINYNAVY